MKTKDIVCPVTVRSFDELSDEERRLAAAARSMTYKSYAPYSHFSVGAAILLDNGEICTGSNQENAAFPSGTCAERTAAYWAHANYPDAKFVKIAIAARGTDGVEVEEPISPCGACRQALLEYEVLAGHDVPVLLLGSRETYTVPSVNSLLPLSFSSF